MLEELHTATRRDPALYGHRKLEAILYPGIWAVWIHRLAHRSHRGRVPFLPRLISQVGRALTGIEIHPGARIGRRLFIGHGAGVVIGETAVIGDDVTLYHHVTLGGRGSDAKAAPSHPVLGDRITVRVGASILGRVQVGDDASIGAHILVLADVPAGARVPAPVTSTVIRREPMPSVHPDVLSLISATPLVSLSRFGADLPARLAAKLESANPGGSVKDRIARAMVEAGQWRQAAARVVV